MMVPIAPFDYASVDPESRIVVQQRTSEIRSLAKRTTSDIIAIGQKLTDVKECLPHGQFGQWLTAEFGWDKRTAQGLMQVADKFKNENFSHLTIAPSALYLLAAPSTPSEARNRALVRAASGEAISHKQAQAIVRDVRDEEEERISNDMMPVPQDNSTPERARGGNYRGTRWYERLTVVARAIDGLENETSKRSTVQRWTGENKEKNLYSLRMLIARLAQWADMIEEEMNHDSRSVDG
jgi:hypothetical protein